MTTPTREQVIEWAKEAGFANAYLPPQFFDPFHRLVTIAYTAGREQGLREAKEVCEGISAGYQVAGRMVALECAAAIEQLRACGSAATTS